MTGTVYNCGCNGRTDLKQLFAMIRDNLAKSFPEVASAEPVFEGPRPEGDEALKRALLSAPRSFEIRAGSSWNEWLSQGVKLMRRPSARDALWLLRGGLRRVLKPGEYVLE